MTEKWQKRRCELNHDWLKNAYIPALSTWINLLNNEIEDPEFEKSFIGEVFIQWEENSSKVLLLIDDFCELMSPKCLFERLPLKRCKDDFKEWMIPFIHEFWFTRYPVKKWVEDASKKAGVVDQLYKRIKKTMTNCSNIHSAEEFNTYKNLFHDFSMSCRELASSIEKFPGEVKVI
jgi:hypothetical protein